MSSGLARRVNVFLAAGKGRSPWPATDVIDAILDTGVLVGALDQNDQWHKWAAAEFAGIRQPALTCDAVISEACFLLRHVPNARGKIFALVERGVVRITPIIRSPAADSLKVSVLDLFR